MPTSSIFYGIAIRMFLTNMRCPIFMLNRETKASIEIRSLSLMEGELPSRSLELVLDWGLCQQHLQAIEIELLR